MDDGDASSAATPSRVPVAASKFNHLPTHSALSTENGLGTNGLGTNGLGTNGLGTNGLGTNGLGTNGLFGSWFNSNITLNDQVMSYLVRCALSSSQSTTFTDSAKTKHTWTGTFGLAPTWLTAAPTAAQQELVSACLMSLVNSNGNHITVSLRGPAASLATTTNERATMSNFDGAFFGNVFSSTQQKYACYGTGNTQYSVAFHYMGRGCAYKDSCNITQIGACSSYCKASPAGSVYPWSSCTYGGKTWTNPVEIYLPGVIEAESTSSPATSATGGTNFSIYSDATESGGHGVNLPFLSPGASYSLSYPPGTYTVDVWFSSPFIPTDIVAVQDSNDVALIHLPGGTTSSFQKYSFPITLGASRSTLQFVMGHGQFWYNPSYDMFVIHP